MAHSELKHKTAKGLFWGGFSNGLQQILVLVFGLYFARKLTDADYGIYGELTIFSAIAGTIINSGFSISLINKKDASQKDYDSVFWFSFLTGLLLYVILFFSAPLIANFFRQPELLNLSRFVFLGFLAGSIGVVPSALLLKQLKTKQIAMVSLFSMTVSLLTGFLMVINGSTYWAIATQNTLSYLLPPVINFFLVSWKPTMFFSFASIKAMIPFCIKMFLTNIVIQINSYIFNVIFGKFYDVEEVGRFYQGQKWAGIGQSFLSGMINNVSQPVFAHINEERERQVNAIRKMIRFGAFISFPMLLGLAFVGREFIVVAATEKWLPALPYMQIICFWGAIAFLSSIFTNLIYAREKSDMYLKITVTVGVLQIAAIASMAYFGTLPMVIGYVIANYVGILIWHHYVKKLTGLRLRDVIKDIFPYLGLTVLCFAITWLITFKIDNIYFLLVSKIIIAALFYIAALKYSNSVIFKESVDFLISWLKKTIRGN